MVYPVTKVTRTDYSNPAIYVTATYEVQKPPYNLDLTFDRRFHVRTKNNGPSGNLDANLSPTREGANGLVPGDILGQANNKSYARMVGKLGDASQLGATLTAERRETWGTLVLILERILRAARNVRKLNLSAAARDLGLPYHERTVVRRHRVSTVTSKGRKTRIIRTKKTYFDWGTGRERLKTVANGWLMWSYGVKPLMEDSYNCIDVLQRPFPWSRISGSATIQSSRQSTLGPPSYFPTRESWSWKVSVRQSLEVSVDNPNLWLANRLGLVNPAQWILEGIPFSFVVDWFSNLSNVVMSLTDFVGLQTRAPLYNSSCELVETFWTHNKYDSPPVSDKARYSRYTSRARITVLPKLIFAYERFQWQRGANAISLLLGILPRK